MTASKSKKSRTHCVRYTHTHTLSLSLSLSLKAASNPEVTLQKTCAFRLSKRPHIKARHRSYTCKFTLPVAGFAFTDYKRAYSIH